MENTFWQANFWGIVGTASGALGLIISWLNWNYSKPKIKVTELKLFRREPKQIEEAFALIKKEQMYNHYLTFDLHIILKNKKGGQGSIEKPMLVISIPNLNKNIIIHPRTKEYESIRISSNMSETKTIDLGKAWNFEGGQTVSDEIEYVVPNEYQNNDDFYNIIKNYKDLQFSIKYHNNFGKCYTMDITDISNQR